ncbi:MAG: hypothetical protein HKM28_06040 [Flavobacteriaceae bacterium]|nr:hypothetical protein [Flavobacteriaceae bacterium]
MACLALAVFAFGLISCEEKKERTESQEIIEEAREEGAEIDIKENGDKVKIEKANGDEVKIKKDDGDLKIKTDDNS